ncbi:MAG: hypothetical protein JKY52_09180 [Flavobacteriales bacterium]|nr:hypothetical protein [Flavobacteriales bacterium]
MMESNFIKITLDVHVGMNIRSVCVEVAGITAKTGLPVEFKFNGVLISSGTKTTVEEMEAVYYNFRPLEEVKQDARPALGLMPRKLFEEQRIADIGGAIIRYAARGEVVPREWMAELDDLVNNQPYLEVK